MTDQYEPECKKNIRAFLKARKTWVADREGSGISDTGRLAWLDDGFSNDVPHLTVADVERLLERDDYAETTRLQLAEACARLRSERDELHTRLDAIKHLPPTCNPDGEWYIRANLVLQVLGGDVAPSEVAKPTPNETETDRLALQPQEAQTPEQQIEYWYEKWETAYDEQAKLHNQLNATYRERAHLVALLASIWASHIGYSDPNERDWAVVIITTPAGQLSWHIARSDMDLFAHVEVSTSEHDAWDGHTTEQKYQRIDRLAADLGDGRPNTEG